MRVITGTARGVPLKAPRGMDTRPTMDQVKEGIFSAIQFEVEGRTALDLFAGSGQLGIEALSRGAAHCTFVDKGREPVSVIRENLKTDVLPGLGRQVALGDISDGVMPRLAPAECRTTIAKEHCSQQKKTFLHN